MQKMFSNCFVQLCAPWGWASGAGGTGSIWCVVIHCQINLLCTLSFYYKICNNTVGVIPQKVGIFSLYKSKSP